MAKTAISPPSSQDSTLCAEELRIENDNIRNHFRAVYRDYEVEKLARVQAQKAFRNLMIMYETKSKKFRNAVNNHRQTFEIVKEMREKYCELKKITDDNMNKLKTANEANDVLKRILTLEKRKIDKVKNEMNSLKQSNDHSACELVLEQETKDKEEALEQIKELNKKMEDITKERDFAQKTNKDMKEKMLELIKIKNELVEQNNTLLFQRNTMQCLLMDKDKQIQQLVTRDVMEDPVVLHKMEMLERSHQAEKDTLKAQVEALTKNIEEHDKKEEELQNMITNKNMEILNMRRNNEELKRLEQDHRVFVEKDETELGKKEQTVMSLIETTKRMKTEMNAMRDKFDNQDKEIAELKEEIRKKEMEISVLGKAKTLYEDKIKTYQCEKESVCHIAREFELQVECSRARLKELENYKYALDRQLTELREELQQEKQHNLIQEKMLEDNRETVKILKCRLKQCCYHLHKSECYG
ncbi:hypothetical protein M8J77_020782 [Diaphorina citri]|nr:hypothetical protein M8J77_020782 [Diaphorina citri]